MSQGIHLPILNETFAKDRYEEDKKTLGRRHRYPYGKDLHENEVSHSSSITKEASAEVQLSDDFKRLQYIRQIIKEIKPTYDVHTNLKYERMAPLSSSVKNLSISKPMKELTLEEYNKTESSFGYKTFGHRPRSASRIADPETIFTGSTSKLGLESTGMPLEMLTFLLQPMKKGKVSVIDTSFASSKYTSKTRVGINDDVSTVQPSIINNISNFSSLQMKSPKRSKWRNPTANDNAINMIKNSGKLNIPDPSIRVSRFIHRAANPESQISFICTEKQLTDRTHHITEKEALYKDILKSHHEVILYQNHSQDTFVKSQHLKEQKFKKIIKNRKFIEKVKRIPKPKYFATSELAKMNSLYLEDSLSNTIESFATSMNASLSHDSLLSIETRFIQAMEKAEHGDRTAFPQYYKSIQNEMNFIQNTSQNDLNDDSFAVVYPNFTSSLELPIDEFQRTNYKDVVDIEQLNEPFEELTIIASEVPNENSIKNVDNIETCIEESLTNQISEVKEEWNHFPATVEPLEEIKSTEHSFERLDVSEPDDDGITNDILDKNMKKEKIVNETKFSIKENKSTIKSKFVIGDPDVSLRVDSPHDSDGVNSDFYEDSIESPSLVESIKVG